MQKKSITFLFVYNNCDAKLFTITEYRLHVKQFASFHFYMIDFQILTEKRFA